MAERVLFIGIASLGFGSLQRERPILGSKNAFSAEEGMHTYFKKQEG
jgi:hypothetical protein